jgi:hypothetical protein
MAGQFGGASVVMNDVRVVLIYLCRRIAFHCHDMALVSFS